MAITFDSSILTLYAGSVANDANYQTPGNFDLPATFVQTPITSITVSNAGSGYTSTPTVSFSGSGGGIASAVLTGTSVATVTVTAPGTGYTGTPTVTLTGPGGSSATASVASYRGITVTVAAGGSGYSVADTITLTGGTFSQAIVVTVDSVDGGGAVTAATVTTPGVYTVRASNPVAQGSTSGGGSSATFNVLWGVNAITVGAGGSGYTGTVTVAITGGGGSGATATAALTGTTIASFSVADGGGYTTVPTVTVTGGGGSNGAGTAVLGEPSERRMLTLIEVIRSYFATITTPSEAKAVQEILSRMGSCLVVGGRDGSYPTSDMAANAVAAAMKLFARQNRSSGF